MSLVAEDATGTRWAPVSGLFVLAPICAEYLLGYDSSTGNWLELGGRLLVLAPLYGASALLIREATRRAGLGTATMIVLAAAWGVVQAGLVDQSMFNPDYRGIAYWDQLWSPTQLPGVGVSAFAAWTFVCGHVVFSLVAPIVIVESVARGQRTAPWLSRGALIAAGLLALGGALVVAWDQMNTDAFRISLAQAASCLVVASVFAAVTLLVRTPEAGTPRFVLPPVVIGGGALVAGLTVQAFAATTWSGLALIIVITVAVLSALGLQSRSTLWTTRHRLSAAAGALLGSTAAGWFIDPIGDVTTADRLAHHAAITAAMIITIYLATRADATTTPHR